jgi:hypothetical protein
MAGRSKKNTVAEFATPAFFGAGYPPKIADALRIDRTKVHQRRMREP